MDALFSDADMAQCCFIPSKKSIKTPLCENKTKIITTGLYFYVYMFKCYKQFRTQSILNYSQSPV